MTIYIADFKKGIIKSEEIEAVSIVKSISVYNPDRVGHTINGVNQMALILVDMIFHKNMINQLTYNAVKRKYDL